MKIDKSFVKDLPESASDSAIARTIVGLSQSLDIEVIAEGVEKKEQLDLLANYGCHLYQGYYFSKPLPAEALKLPGSRDLLGRKNEPLEQVA